LAATVPLFEEFVVMGTAAPQISFEASLGGNHSFITNESLGQQLWS
jgi:hypothetical protein